MQLAGRLKGCCWLPHNARRLFGPVHVGEERVCFDVIHTSHARPQSFHWVVLEQLEDKTEISSTHSLGTFLFLVVETLNSHLLQQRPGLLGDELGDVESGVAPDSRRMAPQQRLRRGRREGVERTDSC